MEEGLQAVYGSFTTIVSQKSQEIRSSGPEATTFPLAVASRLPLKFAVYESTEVL